MTEHFDYKKEWNNTKKQLVKFSKEAAEIAKKGEKELVKFTKRSKLQIDSTAKSLKKEQLCYLIGREYIKTRVTSKPSDKLDKLVNDYVKADQDQKTLETEIKTAKRIKK